MTPDLESLETLRASIQETDRETRRIRADLEQESGRRRHLRTELEQETRARRRLDAQFEEEIRANRNLFPRMAATASSLVVGGLAVIFIVVKVTTKH